VTSRRSTRATSASTVTIKCSKHPDGPPGDLGKEKTGGPSLYNDILTVTSHTPESKPGTHTKDHPQARRRNPPDPASPSTAANTQIPDAHRYGVDLLVRADTAGCSQAFLAHVRGLRKLGMDTFFSVGVPVTEAIRDAITVATAWIPALDADGDLRDGAEIVEITHLVATEVLTGFPTGTRLIVRRERPHPGAQLDLFDTVEGMRHQVIATDTPVGVGSIQYLEVRHRAHARVEDRIRCGKDTGFGRFPSRQFAINAAWLELALTGCDLLAWTQMLCCDGELAVAEPKRLRYQLLHVAARITHGARRTYLRLAAGWPWTADLARAFHRLAALPQPAT